MASFLTKPNEKIGILVAIAAAAIFGVYPAASRAAYADGINVVCLVFVTTFVRAFMYGSFCLWKRKRMFDTKENRKLALTGGSWQALSIIGIVTSLFYIPGPVVLIIVYTSTLMLLFFMAWRGEVKLDAPTVLSTVAALVGLVFVLDVWRVQPVSNWIGIALAFMAAIAAVGRTYVYGNQMKSRDPAVVGAESFVIASTLLLLMLFWRLPHGPATLGGWGWTMASALSLGFGSFAMFYGIALLGAFKWSLFMKIEPIFTSLFSIWFLGEYLNATQYAGIALVLASLVVFQLFSKSKTSKQTAVAAELEP